MRFTPKQRSSQVAADPSGRTTLRVHVDLEDALGLVRPEFCDRHDLDMTPVREVAENIDVSTLDDHVRPNMHPPNWLGVWFPTTGPLR